MQDSRQSSSKAGWGGGTVQGVVEGRGVAEEGGWQHGGLAKVLPEAPGRVPVLLTAAPQGCCVPWLLPCLQSHIMYLVDLLARPAHIRTHTHLPSMISIHRRTPCNPIVIQTLTSPNQFSPDLIRF